VRCTASATLTFVVLDALTKDGRVVIEVDPSPDVSIGTCSTNTLWVTLEYALDCAGAVCERRHVLAEVKGGLCSRGGDFSRRRRHLCIGELPHSRRLLHGGPLR